jgi:hypothetical protein
LYLVSLVDPELVDGEVAGGDLDFDRLFACDLPRAESEGADLDEGDLLLTGRGP